VVTGSNFRNVTAVRFGTSPGRPVYVISWTKLSVTAPARVAGLINVQVFTSYGTSVSYAVANFRYVALPTVRAVAPTEGPVVDTLITLTGTGFANGTAVTIGGVTATEHVVTAPTQLTVRTPARVAGSCMYR
jgi:hypothetical protein